MDYSNKYGLGYLLSNKTMGIYFNDNTKLISDIRQDRQVYYFTRIIDPKDPNRVQQKMQTIDLQKYPE